MEESGGAGTLPGLTPAAGATPFPSDSGGVAPSGSAATPASGDSGQLGEATPAGTSTDAPAAAEAGVETPAATPAEEFEFGGQKFPSREAAEAYYRRADGQYRQAQSATARLENAIRELETRIATADATSRGWYDRAQELERVTSQTRAEQEKAAKDAGPALPFGLTKEDFRFAGSLANEHGFEFGVLPLLQKAEAHIKDLVSGAVQEASGPLAATQLKSQMLDRTMGLWTQATELKDGRGAPLFPELVHGDAATANEILSIWMGLDPRFAFIHGQDGRPQQPNPEAIAHAVWRYRALHGWAPPAAGGAQPTRQGASAVVRSAEAAGAAASEVLDGTGQPRPAAQPTTAAGAIRDSLKKAAEAIDLQTPNGRSLGFSRAVGP